MQTFAPGKKERREPSVAEVVALANRFVALKASPGFHDLKLVAEMLKEDAARANREFQGFDPEEITKLRMQEFTAQKTLDQLFAHVEAAIANAAGLPGFVFEEPGGQVITERIAGSY